MTAYDRLIEKGRKEGRKEERIRKNIAAIKKMIDKGFNNQTISEIFDVSIEFVQKIKLEIK